MSGSDSTANAGPSGPGGAERLDQLWLAEAAVPASAGRADESGLGVSLLWG